MNIIEALTSSKSGFLQSFNYQLKIVGDRFVMVDLENERDQHSIAADSSAERLQAHWDGFLSNHGLTNARMEASPATPRKAVHIYMVHVIPVVPAYDDRGSRLEIFAANAKEAISKARKMVFNECLYDRHDGRLIYKATRN